MSSGAELAIIGALLVSDDAFDSITGLEPQMFSDATNGYIYKKCLALHENNMPVDLRTLKRNCFEKIKDAKFNEKLLLCAQSYEPGTNPKSLSAEIIADYQLAKLRELTVLTYKSANSGNIQEKIADVIVKCQNLVGNNTPAGMSMRELNKTYIQEYTHVQPPGLTTGMADIDRILISLEPKDTICIGARPAVGKSALVIQWIVAMCRKGYSVGFFNCEMSEKQIHERIIAHMTGIGVTELRKGEVNVPQEISELEAAEKESDTFKLRVYSGRYKPSQIYESSKHMGFDIIIVDYLQLLVPEVRKSTRQEEVGSISSDLKGIACKLNIPIVFLSQLNRNVTKSKDAEPEVSDLRESGNIEQDCSVILLAWNLDEDSPQPCYKAIKVGKNRQGTLGVFHYYYDGAHMMFKKLDKPYDPRMRGNPF